MICLSCGSPCHPNAKAPYCLKPECQQVRLNANAARSRQKKRGGRPANPSKRRNSRGWGRTREPTGRTCSLCTQEIFRIIKNGIVIFDNRFTCNACQSRRHAIEQHVDMDAWIW
jgi:hypothetical protein